MQFGQHLLADIKETCRDHARLLQEQAETTIHLALSSCFWFAPRKRISVNRCTQGAGCTPTNILTFYVLEVSKRCLHLASLCVQMRHLH